jgi:phosphatidylserine/phosphatidylglycerophosphate/cardiolipin synthase-like enzyme
LYTGNTDKIIILKKELEALFAHGGMHSGKEIIALIENTISQRLAVPILHILIDEGALIVEKADYSIDGYLLHLDTGTFERYFETQLNASRVIEEIDIKKEGDSLPIEFVATLPPSLIVNRNIAIGSIDHALRRLIVSAKNSIWIANPFFDDFGLEAITESLIAKADKGVIIRLLTRGAMHQKESTMIGSLLLSLMEKFERLRLQDMLEVRDFFKCDESTGRIIYALHSKIVVVDGTCCYIGSANVTQHGLRHNFELGVILRGEEIKPVVDLFGVVWNESLKVTLNDLR